MDEHQEHIIEDSSQRQGSLRTIPVRYHAHVVFLDEEIQEPSKYRDITQLLITCPESDEVNILINSSGGRLDTTCQLIEAIESCSGTVIASVIGAAYSGASMIACAAPNCMIGDSAEFMIHTASYGTLGTTPNVKAHSDFVTKQVNSLLDKTYAGFLTAKELVELKNGKEFWFNADEARTRMESRMKYRNAQAKKLAK